VLFYRFKIGKNVKIRLNRKEKKRVAAVVLLRLLRKHARSRKKTVKFGAANGLQIMTS